MDRYIADQLRAIYDAVTAEPIPDQLLELLDRLDGDGESEGSRGRLGGERRGEDELGAGMAHDNVQRRVQLLHERANYAGAQPPSPTKFEALRKAAAFVADRDGKAVQTCRRDVDPDSAYATPLIGMLRRVRYELIDDQRGRNGAIGRDHNSRLRLNVNFALRKTGAEVLANRFDVSPDIETLDIRRLIQLLVHPCDRAHAERGVLQPFRE